jgi:phospholipid/cholesterol/gamma-HCH transport system substrate-binding protein
MSGSLSRWQALILGLVTFVGLGLTGLALFAVGSRHWPGRDSFYVRAGFADIRGVSVGTRVRIQGVDAGEVVAVVLPTSPGEPVTLRMRIDGPLHLLVRGDATVRIASEGMIGAKVVEISPATPAAGKPLAPPVEDDALLASTPTVDLPEVLTQVNGAIEEVRDGKGVLGGELLGTLQQIQSTMASVQQVGEVGKKVPLLSNYVKGPADILIRPNCECDRYPFAETALFEPGRAVLTAEGRQRLDELAPQLNQLLRNEEAELVVLAVADPKMTSDRTAARGITQGQSEAVCAYLKDLKVQKVGWLSTRKVTALGLGVGPVPGAKVDPNLPAARVEVLVFKPQN